MNDISQLIDRARAQGWAVTRRRSGHWMLTPPTRAGPLIVISGSPSDYRAYAKIRCQLKRAGLRLPATPTTHADNKEIPMPRKPTTQARAQTLTPADEARLLRERHALERGDTLTSETRLDRDLAHLADPYANTRRPVQARRRREPDEVGLVYRGNRTRAALVPQYVTIIVPDEENEGAVSDMQDVIPGLDEDSQRAAWSAEAMRRNREPAPYVPLAERLVLSGVTYTFEKDKAVLVHEDDVDTIMAHPVHRFERADGRDDADEVPPTIGRRGAAVARGRRG